MLVQKIFIIILHSSIFLLSSAEVPPSLKLVHLIFRHGDNLPHRFYPTDPNPQSSYKGYLDQLTMEGKLQMYKLGQYLRSHYDGFLSHRYVPNEVYVRSSDTDRTLTSALSLLAGLYPPESDEMFNPNISWQPIPVHTVPEKEDVLLRPTVSCGRYKMLLKQLEESAIFKNKLEKYQKPIHYIMSKAGIEDKAALQSLLFVLEALVFQNNHQMQLPSWLNQTWGNLTTMEIAQNLYNYFYTTFTGGLARSLLAGNFLKGIQDIWMKWKSVKEKTGTFRKISIFAADSQVLGTVMSSLGNGRSEQFPYGSALLMELHKINNEWFSQLTLIDPPYLEPKILTLPTCNPMCPLESFMKIVAPFVTENSRDCRVNQTVKQAVTSKTLTSQKMNFIQRKMSNGASIFYPVFKLLLPVYTIIIWAILSIYF